MWLMDRACDARGKRRGGGVARLLTELYAYNRGTRRSSTRSCTTGSGPAMWHVARTRRECAASDFVSVALRLAILDTTSLPILVIRHAVGEVLQLSFLLRPMPRWRLEAQRPSRDCLLPIGIVPMQRLALLSLSES